MNEIRDLIIGIDFGKKYSQLCYYDRKAEEARSVSMKVGAEEYEAPTCVCRRVEQNDYCVGIEALYFAQEKGGILVEDLYGISASEEKVQVGDEEKEPWELLACYFDGLLKFLGVMELVRNTRCLVISLPSLNRTQVKNLEKACRFLGFPRERYIFLDYGETFYYYCLTQKRETWNRSVGWFDFAQDHVEFRKLSMNSATRPVLVQLEEPKAADLSGLSAQGSDEEREKRDEEFHTFAEEVLGTDLYASIILTGDGFDQSWAQKSTLLLCRQRRKVFVGNNLFAKGACMAGKEKLEDKKLKGYHYMSDAQVLCDVGMEVRVMGAPTYYSLIEAGRNWYEAKTRCELILDGTRELAFSVTRFGEQEKKRVIMDLPGLPWRPNKTTRISLGLEYTEPGKCRITVKDLGFGDMYPTRGKVWTEMVDW